MRIVFVAYEHPLITPGGAQQVAFEMFQASLAAGHEAFFIAALEDHHAERYARAGAGIVAIPGFPRQYLYAPSRYDYESLSVADAGSVAAFRAAIAELAPDVVHFHHYHRVGLSAIRAARQAAPSAEISMTFHEMLAICMVNGQMVKNPTGEICREAEPGACAACVGGHRREFFVERARRLRSALEDCDHFIFPAEFLAELYLDWGLTFEKCVVIPNGQRHPEPSFDRRRHSSGTNRFGFFGQLTDNKGLDVALEALALLASEQRVPVGGLEFSIHGANAHLAKPEHLERIAELRGRIERHAAGAISIVDRGAYSRDALAARMAEVDWVVVPSTWPEVFGLVASEAWMFGRPVVASAVGALVNRVRPGAGGFTFPNRDARALAEVMANLAGAADAWRSANATIAAPWSETQMLEAHLALWGETIKDRRTNPNANSASS